MESKNLLVNCFTRIDQNSWRDIDISLDFKVYPCCAYHGVHKMRKTFDDDRLDNLPEDWNSLKKHSIEEILEFWSMYLNDEYWSDINLCPKFCIKSCGNTKVDNRKKYE
jgi:hypothetical protein